jgi:hypothetical protein
MSSARCMVANAAKLGSILVQALAIPKAYVIFFWGLCKAAGLIPHVRAPDLFINRMP